MQKSIQFKLMPVAELIPAEYNPRTITDQALQGLRNSVERFGLVEPIVWNKRTGKVVGGHQRLRVLYQLQEAQAQVAVVDLPEVEERALNIALNSDSISGEFIPELHTILAEIEAQSPELSSLLRFDDLASQTNHLLAALLPEDGLIDPEEVPALPDEPVSVPGTLWQLGDHQLLCGDATRIEDVKRIAGDVDLIWIDPPYNVAIVGGTDEKLTIQNDNMGAEEYRRFLSDSFAATFEVSKSGASLYVCHASRYQAIVESALQNVGYVVRNQIIWAKNTFAWGYGRYKFQHEPIFYCHKAGESDPWFGDKTQNTLWEVPKPAASRLHPTMKPVELVVRALQNSSKPGDVVLDSFGGAGSTLIACEQTNRKCRLIELDPRYVDTSVTRWEQFTGQSAVRVPAAEVQ